LLISTTSSSLAVEMSKHRDMVSIKLMETWIGFAYINGSRP
jgi:hypothetical protein